jgi:UDP-hydrolysing UDP-N-acetyl-D-glucosamine 2-epimerase
MVDRANYGRLLPALLAMRNHPNIELQIVLGGSFVLERFGHPWEMLNDDGLGDCSIEMVYHEVEGNTPFTMATSAGFGVIGYTEVIRKHRPDMVMIIGDRYEALGAALAVHLNGVCLIHVQGGETTGHVDDAHRHSISQLATYHVPATNLAAQNLRAMGIPVDTILTIGCPSTDLATMIQPKRRGHLVCVYHPNAYEAAQGATMGYLLEVLNSTCKKCYVFWPNIDAGADRISKEIRKRLDVFVPVKNMHPIKYLELLAGADCLVGNSSSFVREGGFWGVPALIIGDRQRGRETAGNVIHVEPDDIGRIPALIKEHAGGTLGGMSPYWRRGVSTDIAKRLTEVPIDARKLRVFTDRGDQSGIHVAQGSRAVSEVSTTGVD